MESAFRSLFIFIKEIFQTAFIVELPKYYFTPRAFFAVIDNEKDIITIKRIIFYILLYWVVIFILQISFLKFTTENIYFRFIGTVILDFFLYAILISPLFILKFISKPRVSLKTFVVFFVLLRLNFLFLFTILFTLFITQENYLFAALRGLTIYGYFFALIFAFPFVFSFSLTSRIKLIIISAIVVLGMTFLYSELVFKLKLNWKYDVYLTSGDPIGDEVELVNSSANKLLGKDKLPEMLPLDSLLSSTSMDSSLLIKSKLEPNINYYIHFQDSLKNLYKIVNFNTTKEFILIYISYNEQLENYHRSLSSLIRKLNKFYKEGIELKNLREDYNKKQAIIDSIYPKVSYMFDLKPDDKGLIHADSKDVQLFRKMSKIAQLNIAQAKVYSSIFESYTNVQMFYKKLLKIYIGYLDKRNNFLDLRLLLFRYHLIASPLLIKTNS